MSVPASHPIPPHGFLNQESFRESKEVGIFFNPAESQSYIFCYEYCGGTENPLCLLVCGEYVCPHPWYLEC